MWIEGVSAKKGISDDFTNISSALKFALLWPADWLTENLGLRLFFSLKAWIWKISVSMAFSKTKTKDQVYYLEHSHQVVVFKIYLILKQCLRILSCDVHENDVFIWLTNQWIVKPLISQCWEQLTGLSAHMYTMYSVSRQFFTSILVDFTISQLSQERKKTQSSFPSFYSKVKLWPWKLFTLSEENASQPLPTAACILQ